MESITFQERLKRCQNPLLKKLFKIMLEKKTNLCIAIDQISLEKISDFVKAVGPHICMLKVHSRAFGFGQKSEDIMSMLYQYKRQYNFLLFEDAKYNDGKETVKLLYSAGVVLYADIVTVYPDFKKPIFDAIREVVAVTKLPPDELRGCLSVCELSFSNVCRPDSQRALKITEENKDICVGIIGQSIQSKDRFNLIKASPGVNFGEKTDGANQQWRTPREVMSDGADIIIVGRGITGQPEHLWEATAIKYKNEFQL